MAFKRSAVRFRLAPPSSSEPLRKTCNAGLELAGAARHSAVRGAVAVEQY